MDNFFSNALDYNVFKKALKVTDGETVVINILASDDSLKPPASSQSKQQRKSMSSKFEPSPFGKFFGSKNTAPVDMNDFSGWKNKNYRRAEESFEEFDEEETSSFSLANYMKDKSFDTYNELDQARSDVQKPITTLTSDDPTLQKFSLDGYMHKLEESILAKDKFSENDDLLEPIISDDDFVDRNSSKEINKFQDENFFDTDTDIEKFAFDEGVAGNKFSLNSDELDKVKDRLVRLEKETKNLKTRSNQGIITGDELTEDDEESVATKKANEDIDDFEDLLITKHDTIIEEATDSKANRGKKLNEVVMNTDTVKNPTSNANRTAIFNTENLTIINPQNTNENISENEDEQIKKSDILTKEDFRDMTNEFMSKFTELLQPQNVEEVQEEQVYEMPEPYDYDEFEEYKLSQEELQSQINELVESKNKTEKETQEKLKQIEEERRKIDEDYKNRLKEMEESYSKKYEEFKQKMYLDKLSNERKTKEPESKIKIRKEGLENARLNNKQIGAILKKELKSNFNIANLEMEKKLLEFTSQIEKEENKKLKENLSQQQTQTVVKKEPVVIIKEKSSPAKVVVEQKAPPKKTPNRRRRKSTKRRIDSDIIGGISY